MFVHQYTDGELLTLFENELRLYGHVSEEVRAEILRRMGGPNK